MYWKTTVVTTQNTTQTFLATVKLCGGVKPH